MEIIAYIKIIRKDDNKLSTKALSWELFDICKYKYSKILKYETEKGKSKVSMGIPVTRKGFNINFLGS